MAAGCGTPIRGPWAGLETCEPPPGGAARADAARADAARADAARADAAVRDGRGSADRARARPACAEASIQAREVSMTSAAQLRASAARSGRFMAAVGVGV